jgi:caffeoyl-CoA O-methyltransferase
MDHGTYDEHQAYCEYVGMEEPSLLRDLYRETHLKCIHPRMISGRYLGRLLSMISKIQSPSHILEIGTYTGYSALCLAEGLTPGGLLTTIERNDELASIQNRYFSRSGFEKQIEQRIGEALDILPRLEASFDLVFLDADKERYHLYLPLILERCNSGALLLIDNMLWEGKVLDTELHQDEQTQSIQRLTAAIAEDTNLEQVLLPVRDGLMLVRVIAAS